MGNSKVPTRYRARGFYKGSSRESYITTVWRSTKKDAEDDVRMFGHKYTNTRIVSKKKHSLTKGW